MRKMKRSDVPFFNETRNLCKDYLHTSIEYSVEQSLEWFDKEKPHMIIVSVDNQDIGYIRTSNWFPDDDFGRRKLSVMVGMDIHPKFQGNGYSKIAYRKLFDSLRTFANIQFVELYVRKDNIRAINLYKKLGFGVISEEDYNQIPSYYMGKQLI